MASPAAVAPDPLRRYAPSMLALAGVALVVAAPSTDPAMGGENAMGGVALSLLAAGCYAAHTARLAAYGDVPALEQASGQCLVTLGLDVLLVALLATGTPVATGWLSSASPDALQHLAFASVWNGVATCALRLVEKAVVVAAERANASRSAPGFGHGATVEEWTSAAPLRA